MLLISILLWPKHAIVNSKNVTHVLVQVNPLNRGSCEMQEYCIVPKILCMSARMSVSAGRCVYTELS